MSNYQRSDLQEFEFLAQQEHGDRNFAPCGPREIFSQQTCTWENTNKVVHVCITGFEGAMDCQTTECVDMKYSVDVADTM